MAYAGVGRSQNARGGHRNVCTSGSRCANHPTLKPESWLGSFQVSAVSWRRFAHILSRSVLLKHTPSALSCTYDAFSCALPPPLALLVVLPDRESLCRRCGGWSCQDLATNFSAAAHLRRHSSNAATIYSCLCGLLEKRHVRRWQTSRIRPLFKKGEDTNPAKYHLLAISPVCKQLTGDHHKVWAKEQRNQWRSASRDTTRLLSLNLFANLPNSSSGM
jgi:hypothetical protein